MKEKRTKEHSTNKRNTVAVVALLLVCVLAIGGTIAYLTSQSQLTNTFTVGQISPIDPNKPGPGPDGGEIDKDSSKLNGNLYEPSWVKDSKLLPTATIKKDPYVGVGAGSEECDVFVYVKNTMKNNNNIYFEINKGWEAVGGTQPIEGGKYTGGLFKYTAGLNALEEKTNNVWTDTPLFSTVKVTEDAKADDFKIENEDKVGAIEVYSFLHQSKDADGKDIKDAVILAAAKEQLGLNK